jgi:hypothetical protein
MTTETGTTGAADVRYGEHAAYNWAVRRLINKQPLERQRDLLLEALYAVVTTTGEAGMGALMLYVATAEQAGEGEGGR